MTGIRKVSSRNTLNYKDSLSATYAIAYNTAITVITANISGSIREHLTGITVKTVE